MNGQELPGKGGREGTPRRSRNAKAPRHSVGGNLKLARRLRGLQGGVGDIK